MARAGARKKISAGGERIALRGERGGKIRDGRGALSGRAPDGP